VTDLAPPEQLPPRKKTPADDEVVEPLVMPPLVVTGVPEDAAPRRALGARVGARNGNAAAGRVAGSDAAAEPADVFFGALTAQSVAIIDDLPPPSTDAAAETAAARTTGAPRPAVEAAPAVEGAPAEQVGTAAETAPGEAGRAAPEPVAAEAGAARESGQPSDAFFGTLPPVVSADTAAELARNVDRSVADLPVPGFKGDPGRALGPIVDAARARGAAARARAGPGGGPSARIPPPRLPDPLEIDPLPKSTDAVETAVQDPLPELTLPAPDQPPFGPAAKVVLPPDIVRPGELLAETPPEQGDAAKKGAQKAKDDRDAAKKRGDEPVPDHPAEPKLLDPPVLVDIRPKPEPPPTPMEKADLTNAIARLLASAKDEATRVVTTARMQAYAEGALQDNFPTLGEDDLLPETQTALETKMAELRDIVGIAKQDLDRAVSARQKQLEDLKAGRSAETAEAAKTAASEAQKEAAKKKAADDEAARKEQVKLVRKLQAGLHSHDPTLVNGLLTERLQVIEKMVGRGVVAHEQAAQRRRLLLDQYEATYKEAYRIADDGAQSRKLDAQGQVVVEDGKEVEIPLDKRRVPMVDGKPWLAVAQDAVHAKFDKLRADTDTERDKRTIALRAAGADAHTALRAWAAKRLHREQTQDEISASKVIDVATQVLAELGARKEAADNETRARLVSDVRAATQLHAVMQLKDEELKTKEQKDFKEKYTKIAQDYFAVGDNPAEPLSAVAAHLRMEFSASRLDDLVKKLRQKIEDMPIPGDLETQMQLNAVLFSENPPGADVRADRAFKAMDKIGTDEGDVYKALQGCTAKQLALIKVMYKDAHGRELADHIDSEFSGAEYRRAMALLRGDQVAAAAAAVAYAQPLLGGPASREDQADVLDAIRSLPPGEAAKLAATYSAQEGGDFDAALKDTMYDWRRAPGTNSGELRKDLRGYEEANILIELNVAKATTFKDGVAIAPDEAKIRDLTAKSDALAFDRSLRVFQINATKPGADVDMLKKEYERIRSEVSAAHPAWSQEEVDNELRRRMRGMEIAYEQRFGPEIPGGQKYGSTLDKVMKEQLVGGPNLKLAESYLQVDRRAEIASRLQLEAKSGLYSSDDVLNQNLQANWDMAADEVKRIEVPKFRREFAAKVEERRRAGNPMTQTEIEAEQRANDRRMEALINEKAVVNMRAVDQSFGEKFGESWGGKEGALERMLKSETQFGGETEAMWRLKQGGRLNRGQQILLGFHGWDMDKEQVLSGLEGRTAKEIEDIDEEYAKAAEELEGKRGHIKDRVKSEASGRNRFDIDQALEGIPITPEDRKRALEKRIEWEKTAYFHGSELLRNDAARYEYARMEAQYKLALKRFDTYLDANAKNLPIEERNRLQRLFTGQTEAAISSAETYRARVDSYTDTVAQIAAAAAAIVVAVAIEIVTLGTATPAIVALAASLAGTGATIATKAILLDKAYGIHELKSDAVVGAIDAVVAVATAGLGDKLLGIAKATGATKAALRTAIKRVALERAAKPLVARLAAQTVEQFAQAAPSALVGSILNRQNWRGDMFKNVIEGSLTQIATGMGVGFALHGVLHFGGKAVTTALEHVKERFAGTQAAVFLPSAEAAAKERVPLRDRLQTRGSPEERLSAFHEFQEKYPLATEKEFIAAVERGDAILERNAERVRAMQKQFRRQLLTEIPPRERGRFADTPIEVLSDSEFTARTGSQEKGVAAVLIRDGTPMIVVREGTPTIDVAHALREEGIHLRQIAEPANASRVARLDESRLARWPELPLEERMASWQAKLELEVDAQRRMMASLESELANTSDPEFRADLEDRLDSVRESHAILESRLKEVEGFDPRMRQPGGEGIAPPKFTEEPPRLFHKKDVTNSPVLKEGYTAVELERTRVMKDGRLRTYRKIEVTDTTTTPHRTWIREEIFRQYDNKWVLRGSAAARAGERMEIASRGVTEAFITRARIEEPGVKYVAVDAQNASGQGFDEVILRVTRDPTSGEFVAHIGLLEVKDYPNRYIPAADLTAIDDNMTQNLFALRQRLVALGPDGLGMSVGEYLAVMRALDNRDLAVLIRLGPTTSIGFGERASTLPDLQRRLRKRYPGGRIIIPEPERIDGSVVPAAELARQRAAELDSSARFQQLMEGTGLSPTTIHTADTVIKGEQSGRLAGPCSWAPDRAFLFDKTGRPFSVEPFVPSPERPFDPGALADRLLDKLGQQQAPLGGGPAVPVDVVVDVSLLDKTQIARLKTELTSRAQTKSAMKALDRLIYVGES
jgi:Annexin